MERAIVIPKHPQVARVVLSKNSARKYRAHSESAVDQGCPSPPPWVGLWMPFLQNSPQRWVSGSTLILTYASKIAEMNDSDQLLSKTYNVFKFCSVKKKLWCPKVGGNSKKSGNPRKFVSKSQGFDQKLSWGTEFRENPPKVYSKVVFQFWW